MGPLRKDAHGAIREGMIETGRVITAAAAVMVAVFASFIFGGSRVIALFGVGLASAVFLDALVIRCVLLPAVLDLFGKSAWYFPRALDRRLAAIRDRTLRAGPPGARRSLIWSH